MIFKDVFASFKSDVKRAWGTSLFTAFLLCSTFLVLVVSIPSFASFIIFYAIWAVLSTWLIGRVGRKMEESAIVSWKLSELGKMYDARLKTAVQRSMFPSSVAPSMCDGVEKAEKVENVPTKKRAPRKPRLSKAAKTPAPTEPVATGENLEQTLKDAAEAVKVVAARKPRKRKTDWH